MRVREAYAHNLAMVLAGCEGSEEVISASASGVVVIVRVVWSAAEGALWVCISVDMFGDECRDWRS